MGDAEKRKILLIEGCDFVSSPAGGQLTWARHLIIAFPERFALVGVTVNGEPTGRWIKKNICGVEHDFFPVGRRSDSSRRPIVPARLTFFIQLQRWRNRILDFGASAALTLAPESLLAIRDWGWTSLAHTFSGTENPLTAPRYRWARPFAKPFDLMHLSSASRSDVLFAAADEDAIAQMVERSRGRLARSRIVQCATTFDSRVFNQISKAEARSTLGLMGKGPILVTTGRISKLKGGLFLLDAFRSFRRNFSDACLSFVGDGEERGTLQSAIAAAGLSSSVRIQGMQPPSKVNLYLNAADVFVFGSLREGWPTSIVEALACGKPIVSSDVGGVRHLVQNGRNGFVLSERNPVAFGEAIDSALNLPDAESVSLGISRQYGLDAFADRLVSAWPLLAGRRIGEKLVSTF